MIGQAATERVKFVMALAEGIQQAVEIANVDVGCRRQLCDPGNELRRSDGKGLVRAEGGKDLRRKIRLGDRTVVMQVVSGIIGRADQF